MDAFRIYSDYTERSRITLAQGCLMQIENGCGRQLRVENGSVWVTESGSTEDVWLDAGQSFRIRRDGVTLVSTSRRAPFAQVVFDPFVRTTSTLGERLQKFWNAICASHPCPSATAL